MDSQDEHCCVRPAMATQTSRVVGVAISKFIELLRSEYAENSAVLQSLSRLAVDYTEVR